jgi:YD repeat-containing protein
LSDGSGCTAGATDEVITDYDYGPTQGPNNLLLRGVSVTAYVNGGKQVHTTCYSYDIYGNRIGETTPNAGVGRCY